MAMPGSLVLTAFHRVVLGKPIAIVGKRLEISYRQLRKTKRREQAYFQSYRSETLSSKQQRPTVIQGILS